MWRRLLKSRRARVVLLAAIAVAGSGLYWGLNRGAAGADYLTTQIEPGDIIKTISATGTTQAVVTVQVGSQVSGTIAALFADYNSVVRKGQVVAKLDPALFQAQLDQARAALGNAQASVRTARAAVTNAQANLLAAQANKERARVAMQDARAVLERTLDLQKSALVSQRDLEAAQASADETAAQYRQATAQVEQAKAQLLSARSQLGQAKAQVEQAKAAVKLASVNLSHTIITAPIDGVVVARNVDVGQTVAASLQAPTLFLIANDLTKMQVLADIDEADVGQLGPQSRVTFTVDAYPRDVFRGRISQIRLNPQTVQNVVTYTAVIDVDNPELKLKPGMTANVTVTVAERRNVLKLPNAALRFKPELTEAQRKEVAALLKGSNNVARGESTRRASRQAGRSAPINGDGNGWSHSSSLPLASHQTGALRTGRQPAPITRGVVLGWSPANPERPRRRVIWTLGADGRPRPVQVLLGITDGVYSEVMGGKVKANDVVIIGQNLNPGENARGRTSPFGGPFGRRTRHR